MKTGVGKKESVNVITLGCAKNLVDSEVLITQLRGNNINALHQSEEQAQIVIINTCGFIEHAKQESIDTILAYAKAKANGVIEKLFVTGCLSQRYQEDLEREIPEVDAYFGTMELPLLLKRFNADYKHELVGERLTSTASHYAYLKISEGCDRPCSFCAIPLMRGKHRSKPMDALVKEARHLVKHGVKEIMLIAQDSTYYGLDLYGKRVLADLLRRLSDVPGLDWIRLHYAFPSGFPIDILKVMAEKPNICNYLDIPLQHGSTKMLKIMRRGITRQKTEELIHKIREDVPGIAIRTTLIAGHPGETEDDFEEMLTFVEKSRFERLGVFTYSHEEQTHSFTLQDTLSDAIKQERAEQIMSIQQGISNQINEGRVGANLKVLIDRLEGGFYIGRTEWDSPEVDNEVWVDAGKYYLRIGDFANIHITEAGEFDLWGEPVEKVQANHQNGFDKVF